MAPRRTKKAEDLVVVAPDRREHGEAVCDLGAKAFSHGGYYEMLRRCCQGYLLGSHYDWAASRIGFLGGRLITHFGVWGYLMRIGVARVRAGGIGMVATDGEHRRRGLMARTVRASMAAMRDLGYDLSLLFGLEDFYDKFGYVRAWSDTIWTVRAGDLPAEGRDIQVRRFRPSYRPDIDGIYNRDNAMATGTAVRPTYPRFMHPRPMEGHLWTDARGRPAGYVVLLRRGAQVECGEVGGDIEQALRVLAKLARRWRCQEIRFSTFSDASPLIRRLRQGTCSAETHYVRAGGAMVATINLASALRKMARELERRRAASHLARWRGNLVVADERERVTLCLGRSRITVREGGASEHAIRGGAHLAQLLIGADDPAAIIDAAGMRTSGEARSLAEVLFPNQHPQLSQRDRY